MGGQRESHRSIAVGKVENEKNKQFSTSTVPKTSGVMCTMCVPTDKHKLNIAFKQYQTYFSLYLYIHK